MSGTITLLLLIRHPYQQIFPVEIARDKLWSSVKDAIKEKKPGFDDIDADTLDLWKLAIDRSQRSLFKESEDFLKRRYGRQPTRSYRFFVNGGTTP